MVHLPVNDFWRDCIEDHMPPTDNIWDYVAMAKEEFRPPLYDFLYMIPRKIVRRAQSVQEQEHALTPTSLSAFTGVHSVHATVMDITLAEVYEQHACSVPNRNNRVLRLPWEFNSKEQDQHVLLERGVGTDKDMRVGRVAASRMPDQDRGRR